MRILLILGLLGLLLVPALAEGPVDGMIFWMPDGVLKIGDAASEKAFAYSATATSQTFTLRPRTTRWDAVLGQFVIIRKGAKDMPALTVDGKDVGTLGAVTFIPWDETKGKKEVKIEVKAAPKQGDSYLIYCTDDAAKLGRAIHGPLGTPEAISDQASYIPNVASYQGGVVALWSGDYKKAKSDFLSGVKTAATPDSQRLFRRLARWADAEMKFPKVKTGKGFYDMGLYCMVNGFWDLAADSFKKTTELEPKNPDAWYMLGDAMSYKISDFDTRMEMIYPYYKKAAELYPRENSNTYRTYFALCRNLVVKNEQGNPTTLKMTDDQIAYVKKTWEWCSAIMESASHGALRMDNTYKIIDEDVDSLDPYELKPFLGMFPRGTVDTFIKMTGWGASDALGMDCGPNRSAYIDLGIREWDVMLHEWNHTLDWEMFASGLGIGVPETHASDACGFQPISTMGMGHHSCNRYYMTPGMYRYIHGSDPSTTPFVTDWLVSKPRELYPTATDAQFKDQKFTDEFFAKARKNAADANPPAMSALQDTPKVEDGYLNLKTTYPAAPLNAYVFANTYVYSPKKQKVGMWYGSDDNFKLWVNGRPTHLGIYWTCALWEEGKEKDQAAAAVILEKGWNSIVAQITNLQDPPSATPAKPDAWGFSVRFCDAQNKEVSGLKWQAEAPAGFKMPVPFEFDPKSPKTYNWDQVKDDYTMLLPELTNQDLRDITGYKTMASDSRMMFDLSKETLDPAIKPCVVDKYDPNVVGLNNALVWSPFPKELTGVVRYKRGGQTRDLLFLRPEAYEAFLALMPVSDGAKKLGIKRQADQVIGYIAEPSEGVGWLRGVVVVDTYLGEKPPTDEEDLLDIASLK